MPKMVGNDIHHATQIQDNAPAMYPERVPLTYAQAMLMPIGTMVKSLNTTDRGSRGTLAKRWYNWFAPAQAILDNPASTKNMKQRVAKWSKEESHAA